MREDQFERLESLQEKLVDTVLTEADPEHWPGGEKLPKDLNRDERGDRYWCKKNAAATLTLLNKTLSLAVFRDRMRTPAPEGQENEAPDELDKEIAGYEKQAMNMLEKFEKRKGFKVVK